MKTKAADFCFPAAEYHDATIIVRGKTNQGERRSGLGCNKARGSKGW